jgi:hypothetical protein
MCVKIINLNFYFNISDTKNTEEFDILFIHNIPITTLKKYHKIYSTNRQFITIINQIVILEDYYSMTIICKNIYQKHSFLSNKAILITLIDKLILLYYIPKHVNKIKHMKTNNIVNNLINTKKEKLSIIYKHIDKPKKKFTTKTITLR